VVTFLLAEVRDLAVRTFVEEWWALSIVFPSSGGRPQNRAKINGNSSKLCSPQPRPPAANRAGGLSFPLVELIAHVDCLSFRSMSPFPGVRARRWRLVHEAERLGSARKAAQECKATVRVVEKWCRRTKATGTLDDTPRAGRPQAPLASREATPLVNKCVKRGDHCSQLTKIFHNILGVTLRAATVQRYMNKYLALLIRPRKRLSLTVKYMHARLGFAKQWVRKSWHNVVVTVRDGSKWLNVGSCRPHKGAGSGE
jgi:transposase